MIIAVEFTIIRIWRSLLQDIHNASLMQLPVYKLSFDTPLMYIRFQFGLHQLIWQSLALAMRKFWVFNQALLQYLSANCKHNYFKSLALLMQFVSNFQLHFNKIRQLHNLSWNSTSSYISCDSFLWCCFTCCLFLTAWGEVLGKPIRDVW